MDLQAGVSRVIARDKPSSKRYIASSRRGCSLGKKGTEVVRVHHIKDRKYLYDMGLRSGRGGKKKKFFMGKFAATWGGGKF